MTTFCNDTYRRVNDLTIGYAAYKEMWNKLHEMYQLAAEQQKPEGMMILGPSGIGKTRVLMRFAAEFPNRREETQMVCPVIRITMPPKPTENALLYQIALAFGEAYTFGKSYQLQNRVIWLLKNCLTRLLIIDESQHMVRRHNAKEAALAGDILKVIMDEAKTSMVLGGLPEIEDILMADEQIRGRFTYVQSLKPWKVVPDKQDKLEIEDCDNAQKTLVGVLIALARSAGYTGDCSEFEKLDVVRKIYFATDGRIRFVSRLVAATMAQVIPENAPAVTVKHLHIAFQKKIFNRASAKANPFDDAFVERRLEEKGEPFRSNQAWH